MSLRSGMTIKAGTVINAKFHARASGTGMKYWMLEYYDGGEWKPGAPLQTTTVGEGDQAQTFSYNYEMMNTDHCLIDRNMTFEHAINNGDILIRLRCMAQLAGQRKGSLSRSQRRYAPHIRTKQYQPHDLDRSVNGIGQQTERPLLSGAAVLFVYSRANARHSRRSPTGRTFGRRSYVSEISITP